MFAEGSAAGAILRPAQWPGRAIGDLGREFAAPGKTGGFEKQGQNEQGQGHHEDGHLGIGLAGNISGPGRGDAGNKRHNGHSGSQSAEQGNKPDFLSSGRHGYVHGIDVAILTSTLAEKQGNAVRV